MRLRGVTVFMVLLMVWEGVWFGCWLILGVLGILVSFVVSCCGEALRSWVCGLGLGIGWLWLDTWQNGMPAVGGLVEWAFAPCPLIDN